MNIILAYLYNPYIVSIIGGSLIIIILLLWILRLERKLRKLLVGKAENLDESIVALTAKQKEADVFMTEMEKYLTTVEKRLQRSIQSVETIRFNAFDGVGANQSFATALINEHGDGVVFSSLYGRERTSIFSKPVKGAKSEYELSEEEEQAIKKATEIKSKM
jgi:hypothetical protein